MHRKKYELEILRLKITRQDLETAQEQLEDGTSDLRSVLEEFKERITDNQVQRYNQFFFGINESETLENNDLQEHSTEMVIANNSCDPKNNKRADLPPWAKNIYKKIVQRTHPDRYVDFPVLEIKNKFTRIYMDTINAAESNDFGLLLLCAYESEVDYSQVSEAKKYITDACQKSRKEIQRIGTLLGYQWYHVEDENKLILLENYLKQLGFKFDKAKAQQILNRKPKRRTPGMKPKNLIRVKRNKAK